MRRILFSVMIIALVAGMSGAGLSAIFSDTETSTGNTIRTSSSPDLWLDDGTPVGDSVMHTWTMSNMAPGVSEFGEGMYLWDRASTEAASVAISISNVCTEIGHEESDTMPDSAEGMDRSLQIVELTYAGQNLLYTGIDYSDTNENDSATLWDEIDDVNGNGFVDLDDFESYPLTSLTPVPPANEQYPRYLYMKIKFHETAPNDYQGDQCDMTMTVVLED